MEIQETKNSQNNLEKKVERLTLTTFKTQYKATAVKTVWKLAREQACRSMKQNGEFKNKPIYLWPIDF